MEPRWNWSESHPVVHLDLSGGVFHEPSALQRNLAARLEEIEDEVGIVNPGTRMQPSDSHR